MSFKARNELHVFFSQHHPKYLTKDKSADNPEKIFLISIILILLTDNFTASSINEIKESIKCQNLTSKKFCVE